MVGLKLFMNMRDGYKHAMRFYPDRFKLKKILCAFCALCERHK